jgi:hypothetical protein
VLGERFVVSIPYAKLSGGAGARFNAEMANRLLVYVNESPDADDHKFNNRNAAREALRDFVEPNHRIPFRVEPKRVDAYYTRASISTLILTNNINGLPLNEQDRRIAVVINGPQMNAAEREEYQAWMLKPENIGALYRHLRDFAVEQDTAIFDPYLAPKYHGRDLMIDAGKTAIDHAWEAALERLEQAADLYAMSQIVAVTRHFLKSHRVESDDLVRRHTVINGHRIGVKNGANWLVSYSGERERVYAFGEAAARRWTRADPRDIKAQLDKAQKVAEAPMKAFNKLLHSVDTGTKED